MGWMDGGSTGESRWEFDFLCGTSRVHNMTESLPRPMTSSEDVPPDERTAKMFLAVGVA